ncbi:hypothetical protein JAAARDRAFT_159083, partial [Jaapia argillacea MUCL 33604]
MFVGMVFGPPLTAILDTSWLSAINVLGYVGLCAMVLEGGLNTPLGHALPSLPLSICVAITGITFPICISLLYFNLFLHPSSTLLDSFAAGAALSSTSLGTTFAVIGGSGLAKGKLGAVLMTAAMADDVVGLVLLKVVVVLGQSDHSHSIGWIVARPIVASVGLIFISWILARWVLKPTIAKISGWMPEDRRHEFNFIVIVLTTTGYIAVASLAGTSVLLGAFISGIVLASISQSLPPSLPSFQSTFALLISPLLSTFLQPVFFASIGFAIPVRRMFEGRLVWRGLVYALLMMVAKMVTGVWVPIGEALDNSNTPAAISAAQPSPPQSPSPSPQSSSPSQTPEPPSSLLIPSTLLSLAMVARGEIGLLIAQLSRSASLLDEDLFLISVWAIVVCTIVGPVGV